MIVVTVQYKDGRKETLKYTRFSEALCIRYKLSKEDTFIIKEDNITLAISSLIGEDYEENK